ncbi:hypothetical protein LB505_009863 [Fusarium chuoi]|nr:hypothetical protein LB505_009863 [Fusarium chuoi]
MKGCSYCHRTFHKTEHLLRHERSRKIIPTWNHLNCQIDPCLDTGEKPYRCDTCGRGYARRASKIRCLSEREEPTAPTKCPGRFHKRVFNTSARAGRRFGRRDRSARE